MKQRLLWMFLMMGWLSFGLVLILIVSFSQPVSAYQVATATPNQATVLAITNQAIVNQAILAATETTESIQITQTQEAVNLSSNPPPQFTETPSLVPTDIPYYLILVALKELPRGTPLTSALAEGSDPSIGFILWPIDAFPQNGYSSLEELFTSNVVYARSDIPQDTPILSTQIVKDLTQLSEVGSDLALAIPIGELALPLDRDIIANMPTDLTINNRVDILASFSFDNGQAKTCLVDVDLIVVEVAEGFITVTTEPQFATVLIWLQDNQIPLTLLRRATSDSTSQFVPC